MSGISVLVGMKLLLFFIKFILVSLLLYTFTRVIRWFQDRQVINKVPGPSSNFLIGNMLDLIGVPEKAFKNLRAVSSKYNIYRLWMGYIGSIHLKTPEDIETVISSTENLEKSQIYRPLLAWLNAGLLTSGGAKWHNRRKLLTPAFHFNILLQFLEVFSQKTSAFINELEKQISRNQVINIVPAITQFTLGCICETSMGTALNENDPEQNAYKQDIHDLGILVVHRVLRPWLYINLIFFLTPTYWKQRAITKRLHTFTLNVIKQRKDNFSDSINCTEEEAGTRLPKKRLAMLDLMLTAQKEGFDITDDGIREEVDTFMFEAHDTTSAGICFTLLLLANHADVQQKVYEELMEVFGDSDRTPTYSDLQNLRYLEMCIKESLRLYPSVPLISRLASKDIDTLSGYRIPNGSHILIHIYDLHHNPDVYPDPEKFDPERFLPENCIDRHPFAYLPFSGGPRNCIGQKFALLEIKALISGILRKYKLLPIDTPGSITFYQDMVLRAKGGINIKFCQRNTTLKIGLVQIL